MLLLCKKTLKLKGCLDQKQKINTYELRIVHWIGCLVAFYFTRTFHSNLTYLIVGLQMWLECKLFFSLIKLIKLTSHLFV